MEYLSILLRVVFEYFHELSWVRGQSSHGMEISDHVRTCCRNLRHPIASTRTWSHMTHLDAVEYTDKRFFSRVSEKLTLLSEDSTSVQLNYCGTQHNDLCCASQLADHLNLHEARFRWDRRSTCGIHLQLLSFLSHVQLHTHQHMPACLPATIGGGIRW